MVFTTARTINITHKIHGAAIYGNIYHPYTPNVSIYTIHGSYGLVHKAEKFCYVGIVALNPNQHSNPNHHSSEGER